MHKFILNLFGFLKSSTQFLKIIVIFLIAMLILYWMQDLTNKSWAWFGFISPLFDTLLDIGKDVSSKSIKLFAAVFEFKYLVVLIFMGVLYFLVHALYLGLNVLEDVYDSGRRMYKNIEEKTLNMQLAVEQSYQQKKLKYFQVYVQGHIKPNMAHRAFNVDLEEQNKILVKHLLDKTGVCPNKYENGFLFNFSSFDKVDEVLDVFSKLYKSKTPLDFQICLQIIGQDAKVEAEELNTLIGLKMLNQIICLANTAYRYGFNVNQRYNTSQVGCFQKGKDTFEIHEFISKE